MKTFGTECDSEECGFGVKFDYDNTTFFYCKEHKFGVNVPHDKLNTMHICSYCKKEMKRYDLDDEDNLCPICEKNMMSVMWVRE